MAEWEIDSFVKKFKLLRSSGYDASLNLECKLGEVYVTLNCKVGRSIPPLLSTGVLLTFVVKKGVKLPASRKI